MFGFSRSHSLRKSRHILSAVNGQYRKQWKSLTPSQLTEIESLLAELDTAIRSGDRDKASALAEQAHDFGTSNFRQRWWASVLTELPLALCIALVVAVFVRQMWFELYQIPTGSMRPSFKEQDHLIVSKTTFGINVPLSPQHLYFDPDIIRRTGVVIFTAENLDTPNPDTKYFWIFNAKKRFIKRLMGKPGDSLYFYGGKIYGVDEAGNEINELLSSHWLEKLEHIPFGRFEGRATRGSAIANEVYFSHMHQRIGRLSARTGRGLESEVYSDGQWVPEAPLSSNKAHTKPTAFADFFGIRNFAMVRLLSSQEVERYTEHNLSDLEEAEAYLELFHSPSLQRPGENNYNTTMRGLYTHRTLIPLKANHLQRIRDSLYTARFIVQNGQATPYGAESQRSRAGVALPGVPDGTYEFYYGKARQIGWGGRPIELELNHPIYSKDFRQLHTLYNAGIEMLPQVLPSAGQRAILPSRYAYFRDGALYLMGSKIYDADDPVLANFVQQEERRESSSRSRYVAFRDYGPPLKEDGSFDLDFIRSFGYTIPQGSYVMLGDNHAMSADSRYFGPVPEENLRGTPTMLLWPWDERGGQPPHDGYPLFTTSRMIVWAVALLIFGTWYLLHRRRIKRPIFIKLSVV